MAKSFYPAVSRLRQITGFVSVFGEAQDNRLSVFARLWHVRRVLAVLRLLTAYRADVDIRRATIFVWLHDLNRWPFAHNTEKGRFNQSANTPDFLQQISDIVIDEYDLMELRSIQDKTMAGLSADAQVVLLADAITGMLEDPLMLICALNVRPDIVPDDVTKVIGLGPAAEPWRTRCAKLAALLRYGSDASSVTSFQRGFRQLFVDQARVTLRLLESSTALDPMETLNLVRKVKRNFIRPTVFPINNELVCHSKWLRSEIMPWYLERFDENDLVFLTESQFVERIVGSSGSPFRSADFIPDIDAVKKVRPSMAFIDC